MIFNYHCWFTRSQCVCLSTISLYLYSLLYSTFSSSAPSSVIPALQHDLHLSHESSVLTISLFVAGYCIGPLLWGPLSEQVHTIQLTLFLLFTLISSLVDDPYSFFL